MRAFSLKTPDSLKGFTIVELLIVIVVIGILASVALIGYNGIRQRAEIAVIKSDLGNAVRQLKSQYSLGNGYPTTASEANEGRGFQASGGTTLAYGAISGGYCLSATSSSAGVTYHISSTNDWTIEEGACPDAPALTAFIAGGHHTCALKTGAMYCWGYNDNGQLGDNTLVSKTSPIAVDTAGVLAGKTITAFSPGIFHTCAIADGAAYCWGLNSKGQLGNSSTTNSPVPVAVTVSGVLAGKAVTAISAGQSHTCAIAGGQAYCWGENLAGQLGNNSTATSVTSPVAVNTGGVLAGKTLTSIKAGGDSATNRSCAISDGAAYCWGANSTYGALGNGSTAFSSIPVAVYATGALSGKTVTSINMGIGLHTCVVASAQAFCWGFNSYGQLGDGTTAYSAVPVAVNTAGVLAGKTVTQVAVGSQHACAIADGAAYCWGRNNFGQFGVSSPTTSSTPTATNASGVLLGKTLTSITSFNSHVCATATSETFCWGYNASGQLGDGTTNHSLIPITAPSLP